MPETSKDVRLRLLVDAVNHAGKVLDDTSRDLQEISDKAERLGNATGRAADKGAAALSRFEQAAKKLNTAFKKMETAGERMQNVGTQMAFLGAGLAAAAAAPIKAAADFERTMSKVQAISGATGKTFDAMADKAKELGRTTRFSAKEAAEGMVFLSMTGFSAKEVIDTIGPSLQLAAAGGMELGEAADIASNVIKQFSLPVEQLGHVVDAMANTAASANTNVRQLATALAYSGKISETAGLSLDETAAIIGVLGDSGIQASKAGTSLLGTIAALSKITPASKKIFDRLGVTVSKTADGSLDLVKTLEDLRKAGMTNADAFTIFQRRAATTAITIGENADRVRQLTEANEKAIGAGQRMAKMMEENLGGALIELRSAFEGFMIEAGEPLLKQLAEMVKSIAEVVRGWAEWAKEHPKMASKIIAFVGVLGSMLLALGAVLLPLGIIVKTLGILGPVLVSAAGGSVSLGKSFISLGAGAEAGALGTLKLNTAMKTTMLSISALVALFIYSLKTWNAALDALEARQEKLRAKRREEIWAAIETAKVKAFNEATGESAKSLREVNQLQKEKLYYRDLITRQWKQDGSKAERDARIAAEAEAAADKRAAEAAKKRAEAEVGGDGGEGDTEALEKKKQAEAQIILETKRLQIQAMDDEVERLEAQKALEIQIFQDSENAKVAAKEVVAQKIQAIEDAYTQRIGAIAERKREEEEKLADQEREKAEQAAQQKIEQQLAFQEETKKLKISMMEDDYKRLQAETEFELEALRQRLEAEEITLSMFEDRKAIIEDQYRQRKLALDEAAAEATQRMWDRSAGKMEDIFSSLYEISGRKVKAFFYMQRAVAVAQAIMDTLSEVSKVGAQTGIFGIPMKAMVYAQGMARVALIAAQTIRGFAEGGLVKGKEGKDNIIARLTNKEFVMPVEAVQHYGLNVMEAIRRRAIEISSTIPQYAAYAPSRPRYQEGGLVAPTAGMDEEKPTLEATIVNITDPREIEAFLASARGQNVLVNAISSQAPRVRRVLR